MTTYKLTLLFVWQLIFCCGAWCQSDNKPNIILIVADDLGYSDLGCYGGEMNTPALDKLADEGVRFPNMFNAGMCVLSRSSLLTGQWWPTVGYGIKKGPNIAQKLKETGYRTGLVGKWHLDGIPNDKGFDYFFGFVGGFSSYFHGSRGEKGYHLNKQPFTDFGDNFYSTDAFTEHAINFITPATKNNAEPFFLYLSYQSPHNPLQAPKEDILKHRGNYLKGWQAIREARLKKQIELGIIDSDTPIPAYPENLPDWDSLSPEQKDLEDLRMSVYAAMVERMDAGIGQLLTALEVNGQLNNTLILFMSDNGTDSFSVVDANMLEKGLLPGDVGSNYQPGTGWAYASVTPNRLYKISQHNGGVKTGAIAYWPKRIQKQGTIQPEPVHVVDIAPTLLDISKHAESTTTQLAGYAGQSMDPLFSGEKFKRKSPLFFQFMDNRAIRTEKWSLVEVDGSGWELYNLKKDPLETNDLSKKQKRKVRKLNKSWLSWWKKESNEADYIPESTATSIHYKPQGDRGTGEQYIPSAMPEALKGKYQKDE